MKKFLYCKHFKGGRHNFISGNRHGCTHKDRVMLHKNKDIFKLKQPSKIKKIIHKLVPYKNCVLGNLDKSEYCELYEDKFILPI